MAAVRAASDSASLALQSVEASVQHFVEIRDYMRLKDMAEASAVAGQVTSTSTLTFYPLPRGFHPYVSHAESVLLAESLAANALLWDPPLADFLLPLIKP